jgi:hypothetical protein
MSLVHLHRPRALSTSGYSQKLTLRRSRFKVTMQSTPLEASEKIAESHDCRSHL